MWRGWTSARIGSSLSGHVAAERPVAFQAQTLSANQDRCAHSYFLVSMRMSIFGGCSNSQRLWLPMAISALPAHVGPVGGSRRAGMEPCPWRDSCRGTRPWRLGCTRRHRVERAVAQCDHNNNPGQLGGAQYQHPHVLGLPWPPLVDGSRHERLATVTLMENRDSTYSIVIHHQEQSPVPPWP